MSKNTIDLTQNVDDIIKNMAGIIENILLQAHPVGSYYFSDDPTDPGELFGGTWEALTPGYTLVAQGTATEQHGSTTWTKEFKAGEKYGEFEHQLTVGEMPSHRHAINSYTSAGGTTLALLDHFDAKAEGFKEVTCGFSGSNQYHNNMSPCISSYAWKRTS